MMLTAIRAETLRIPNGSNHHLLNFAPICSLLPTGSRLRRLVSILFLVSILSCALRFGFPCVERRALIPFEHAARYQKKIQPVATLELSFHSAGCLEEGSSRKPVFHSKHTLLSKPL
jgi:hypothetical protein